MADTNRKINIWINGAQVENTYKGITNAIRKSRNELANMTIGSRDYINQTSKIKKLQGLMDQHRVKQGLIAQGWQKITSSIKQVAIGNIISNAFTSIAASVQGAFAKITTATSDFEGGMTNVFTLLDDNSFNKFGESLKSGSKQVAELGFNMNDTNKALFDAISAGIDAGDSIEYLNEVAILAKGGVTSLGTAVDGNTTILNAYNLATSEAGNVNAAFFSAQKEGKTTVDELASSIGKAAPIAASLGISYQELLSATAALTKKGIATKESMTYLKAAFSNLMKPSTEAEKILRKFGVPVGATEIKAAGLTEVLTRLNEVIKENPDEIAKAIPSVEALTAVQALSGAGLEEYQRILQNVQTDIGDNSSLQKAYQKQMESFPNVMAQAREKLNNFAITIGEKLAPVIKEIVPIISGWTKKVIELIDWVVKNGDAIKTFITWIAKASLVVAAYSAIQKIKLIRDQKDLLMTNALAKAKQVLNNIMAKAPWAIAIAGIAAVIAGLYDLYKSFTKVSVAQKSMNDILAKSQELMIEDSRRLDSYKKKLLDVNTSQEERKKIIADINTQYGQYLPQLLTENSTYNEISKALGRVNSQLSKKYELQAAEEKAVELKKRQVELEQDLKKLDDEKIGVGWLQELSDKSQKIVGTFTGANFIAKQFGVEKQYISDLTDELEQTDLAYKSIEERINKIQAGVKTYDHESPVTNPEITPTFTPTGNKEEAEKASKILDDYQKKYEQVRQKILEIRKQLNQDELSEEEKQRQAITEKYDEQLSVVDGFIQEIEAGSAKRGKISAEELDLLQRFHDQKLQLIETGEKELLAFDEKIAKEREKLQKENAAKLLQERQKAQKQIDEQLMDENTREVMAVIDKYKELLDLADKYGIDTAGLYQKMHEEIRVIQENLKGDETDIFGMSQEDWEKLRANFETLNTYANQARGLAEAYFSLQSQREQAALQEFENSNEKKKASLDDRLKRGLISQKKYDSEVERLDKALDIEKKKIAIAEAERSKKIRRFDTIMNTAAAIVGFLANPGGLAGVALSVAAGITGGIQLAAINEEPLPQFAKGARVNKPTKAIIGEAGPEIVLASKIVQSPKYGPLADDLARIQEGKQPRFLNKPSVPNFNGMKEAIGRSVVNSVTNNTVVNQVDSKAMTLMKEELTEMKNSIFDMAKSVKNLKYLNAIISSDQMTDYNDEEVLRKKYSGF
ncbi:MAG: phage tail tape measure protein [Bacteroidales bacterium]|nr:phage tail tape measure protein [Bacteroidales bacterium]